MTAPRLLSLALVLCAGTAGAEPRPAELAYLTRTARKAAAEGDCDDAKMIGRRVQQLSPAYYAASIATDTVIASCDAPTSGAPVDEASSDKSPILASILTITGSAAGIAVGSLGVAGSEVAGEHGASGLVVLGGYTLASSAFVLGPSFGRLYAGGGWNWWLRLRMIGVGAFVVGATVDYLGLTGRAVDAPGTGIAFGVLGGGLAYAVGMIGENIAVPIDVVHHNDELHGLAIVPLRTRSGGLGLALASTF